MNKRIKEMGLGFLALLAYFGLDLIDYIPYKLAGVNPENVTTDFRILYMLVYEILVLSIVLIIFNKKVEKDLDDILKNHKKYYSNCLKYYLIGLIVMALSNAILALLSNGGIANNEEAVRSMFKLNPVYIYLSAVLFAPVVEELVFRQGLRNIFGRNIIFVLISGVVFGGLHVLTSMTSTFDLLYLIPYSTLGLVFAFMLYKTDNIFVSIGFHFMHNGILMAIQFVTFLF